MKYFEYKISVAEVDLADVLVWELGELGFDSFTEWDGEQVCAYITHEELFSTDSKQAQIKELLDEYNYEVSEIEQQNWNQLWESNFEPISLGRDCYIRAPFHEPCSGQDYDNELIIMPKMSFGTGHHSTTCLMVRAIVSMDVAGKVGLDMGSGTGILAILAAKRGAKTVDAIDIDEWAKENCSENAELNGVSDSVVPYHGDASLLEDNADRESCYDFVLANINRNILIRDMKHYVRSMKNGAAIAFSGFLEFDVPAIESCAVDLGLSIQSVDMDNGWACIIARK